MAEYIDLLDLMNLKIAIKAAQRHSSVLRLHIRTRDYKITKTESEITSTKFNVIKGLIKSKNSNSHSFKK